MLAPHIPTQDYLLSALPAADCECLLPQLESSPSKLGSAPDESGGAAQYLLLLKELRRSLPFLGQMPGVRRVGVTRAAQASHETPLVVLA